MINPEKLSILERTHRLVAEFVDGMPDEVASVKPSAEAFSVTEIVFHLADVEQLWHDRFAAMQASESAVVFSPMDPPAVAREKNYNAKPLATGMSEWTALREKTYTLAQSMPEELLHKIASHPRYGEMIIFRMFDIMANHDLQHLEQMKRTLKQVSA